VAVRQRSFWKLTLHFGAVYVPLAVAATIVSMTVFLVPPLAAALSSTLISAAAFVAVLSLAIVTARRFDENVRTVRDLMTRVSVGDFEKRIPADQRYFIEPVAEAADRMQEYLDSRFVELRASRDQLRTVLDSMVEGVIAVDSGQRVRLVNESACRLFRISADVAVGRPLWELVRSPQLQQWVTDSLRSSEPLGGEIELVPPASRTLSVRVAGLPEGVTHGAVVVASDISELRRLEQVRQEFVSNASHELKTPLASIKACVETLLDGAQEEPEIRGRFLQTVNEQCERLDTLVRDLLSLTRIESQGMKADLHLVPLEAIVTICHERHRQHAERQKMRLVVEPPNEPLFVLGDEEALEQIVDNLVDNAIKYTNEGGTVTIRWRRDGAEGVLEVEDTGIGIPLSHLPRIFERFYRVDKARSRELGGTGLGLAIVKHLIQSLGGAVRVTSRLGKGSTFTVRLRIPESLG
jgi:two-component system, OmpR family, phosphate regulon sensor histidine kinase PhoR